MRIVGLVATRAIEGKPQKCKWRANTLKYLGHIVGNGQVAVPEGRVQALRDFKRPVTKKDLSSFLGTTYGDLYHIMQITHSH